MNGLLTEQEWRRRAQRKRRKGAAWCGAQCLLPCASRADRLRQDRSFRLFLLLSALAAAVTLPLLVPQTAEETFTEQARIVEQAAFVPRAVSEIAYALPAGEYQTHTFTRAQLLRGKLLLLDAYHALPQDAPPPNTFSIAAYANGMVPVASLGVKSGRETIAALQELFGALRKMGVDGLAVSGGATSAAQQRQVRRSAMASLMRTHSPAQARQQVLRQLDAPDTGEMLQEYAVEICLRAAPEALLETSAQGQALLQMAWRHGFVRPDPETRPHRFRYVGRAHATAMTYLDLNLEDYLLWLHQKGTLAIRSGETLRYLILCKPMTGTHLSLSLPSDASHEVSLDNMGYAVAACTW